MQINCGCRTTYHGAKKHEMLLPKDMCPEHRAFYEACHAESSAERARARAAIEAPITYGALHDLKPPPGPIVGSIKGYDEYVATDAWDDLPREAQP